MNPTAFAGSLGCVGVGVPLYSLVLPCIPLYSLVFPCIALYSLVFPCIALCSLVLSCTHAGAVGEELPAEEPVSEEQGANHHTQV